MIVYEYAKRHDKTVAYVCTNKKCNNVIIDLKTGCKVIEPVKGFDLHLCPKCGIDSFYPLKKFPYRKEKLPIKPEKVIDK